MILVDTNVISELVRPLPDANASDWLKAQKASELFVSAISIGEIYFGLHLLPVGRRRRDLETRMTNFIRDAFGTRVLDYTEGAAHHFAELKARRRKTGSPMSVPDAQIAGIALEFGAQLATRNMRDFRDYGLALVNPFEASV